MQDADPAEIIRSDQKDTFYINNFKSSLSEIVQRLLGPGFWLRWRKELSISSDVAYFALTTVTGFQTLGEEYVNILQVNRSRRSIPSNIRRLLLVFLRCLSPYIAGRFLTFIEKQLESDILEFRPDINEYLTIFVRTLRTVLAFLHRCHLGVFYLQGAFYDLAKRATSIRYIKVRPTPSGGELSNSYRLLGCLYLVQQVVTSITYFYDWYKPSTPVNITHRLEGQDYTVPPEKDKCALCLGKRRHVTVTPCGHLFCWTCIIEWCMAKPQCPLCRSDVVPSRLVYLQNYDSS